MRAEARGGGEGILGWHCRAISTYTWCVTEKGSQRGWLHKIGKADTPAPGCHSQSQTEQSGKHTVEECEKLTELRKEADQKGRKMGEWQTRHLRSKEKGIEKGTWG